jgi:choline-sulfatase
MPQWNLRGQLDRSQVPHDLFDTKRYRMTSHENLDGKPTCHRSYRETYPQMLQPTPNTLDYRRFYYQLQENVNREIQKVLHALNAHRSMAANTIVIFTSDHGEMLGAHGNMHQKWHQAYEESTHVPFLIHNPTVFPGRRALNELTSHADVLPTMLGLAGLDPERLRTKLARTHSEAHRLVGRDLSGLLLGEHEPSGDEHSVYFTTDDEISRGLDQVGFDNRMYSAVAQPNHLETVVAILRTGPGGTTEKWKYTRYFDTPSSGATCRENRPPDHLPPERPPQGEDIVTLIGGNVDQAGNKRATTTVKEHPVADQAEVYNLTQDPLELTNLIHSHNPHTRATVERLRRLLERWRRLKRRTPSSGHVPGQKA